MKMRQQLFALLRMISRRAGGAERTNPPEIVMAPPGRGRNVTLTFSPEWWADVEGLLQRMEPAVTDCAAWLPQREKDELQSLYRSIHAATERRFANETWNSLARLGQWVFEAPDGRTFSLFAPMLPPIDKLMQPVREQLGLPRVWVSVPRRQFQASCTGTECRS